MTAPKFTTTAYRNLVRLLTARRKSLGLNQLDLDQIGGFASGQTAKWESFARVASGPHLDMWCSALGYQLLVIEPRDKFVIARNRLDRFGHVVDKRQRP